MNEFVEMASCSISLPIPGRTSIHKWTVIARHHLDMKGIAALVGTGSRISDICKPVVLDRYGLYLLLRPTIWENQRYTGSWRGKMKRKDHAARSHCCSLARDRRRCRWVQYRLLDFIFSSDSRKERGTKTINQTEHETAIFTVVLANSILMGQ
jgi:hypothetical protein